MRKFRNIIPTNYFKFINDVGFITTFENICHSLNITEYYLLNQYGNYLMINSNDRFVFVVYTKEQLNEFCDLYSNEYALNIYVKKILNEQLIPFLGLKKDISQLNYIEWKKFLFPAKKSSIYYWSVIKLDSNNNIHSHVI